MTSRPYTRLLGSFKSGDMEYQHAECVVECEIDEILTMNRCEKSDHASKSAKKDDTHVKNDKDDTKDTKDTEDTAFEFVISKSWLPVLLSTITAGIFSCIILVLFRYYIKQIIWGLYIGIVAIFFIISLIFVFAYLFFAINGVHGPPLLIIAAVFGIIGTISAVCLYLFRNRISLVIAIFKEAAKVFTDIAPILVQPVITMIIILCSVPIFGYFALIIYNSGDLKSVHNDIGEYQLESYQMGHKEYAAMAVNAFIYYWFLNFVIGCQHFIIANAVSQWYFTRDKTKLVKPLNRAFYQLRKFHLGTLCLGSFLITVVKVILAILRSMLVSNYLFKEF